MRSPFRPLALTVATALLLAACGGGSDPSADPGTTAEPSVGGSLTVYSGRSETLVGPVIERFEAATGVDVEVNYAGTTDLAATILEEGDASPADVFFAQDAGALGAVAAEGRLAELPQATLDRVDARFRADDGRWVGVSGRARVVVYDTRVLDAADLPTSIDAFTDPAWKDRIGWAPTNASLHAFVTAYRTLKGDEAAKAWLEGIVANGAKVYEGNDAVLAAVAAGEVEVGFVNHYYLMRTLAEQGESYPVRNHFLDGADPGSLINVAGAGILSTAKNPAAAQAFVDFLLSTETQEYFSTETHEYPLIAGVEADPALPPLADVGSPDIDLSDLADLAGTLQLMQEAGVL
ncbi:MAG: iron ABC transporter substrate-binding protein [Candidatus Limnocylindria bacterium]